MAESILRRKSLFGGIVNTERIGHPTRIPRAPAAGDWNQRRPPLGNLGGGSGRQAVPGGGPTQSETGTVYGGAELAGGAEEVGERERGTATFELMGKFALDYTRTNPPTQ